MTRRRRIRPGRPGSERGDRGAGGPPPGRGRRPRGAPGDPAAVTQRSALELSRHDFRAGLADALRARALAPAVNKPFGVLVDALVELGRYGAAGRALQEMVDRHP